MTDRIQDKQTITLDFYGPYKFVKGNQYLYYSEFVEREGIYIWTIKDEKNGNNFVHYIDNHVGTKAQRLKQKLIINSYLKTFQALTENREYNKSYPMKGFIMVKTSSII